jgi:hypothetical protein
MRVKNKNAPYVHEPRPEIERFANQTEWEPDTLVDVEPTVGNGKAGTLNKRTTHGHTSESQGKEAPARIIFPGNRGVIGGI